MAKKKNGSRASNDGAYPQGTPLSDEGLPSDEVAGDRARSMPLDAESMRVNEQHRATMRRKNAGEKNVPWNSDFAIRFQQVKEFHPNCRIAIEQIEPRPDNTIEARPIAFFRDHDALVGYIRDIHWRGEDATYKWRAYDDLQPQWAVGRVNFTANPEWAARRSDEATRRAREPDHAAQPPPPQQQQPPPFGAPGWPPPYPYGGYQVPGYVGGLPPIPGMGAPPGYVPQPQQPQPQQPAAPPPGYAPPSDVMMLLLQHLTQSTMRATQLEERARDEPIKQYLADLTKQVESLRQQPQNQQYPPGYWDWYLEKMKAALVTPGAGVPGGPPSPSVPQAQVTSPLQPVREAIGMMREVTRAGQEIAAIVSPRPDEPTQLQPNPSDETFPFDVKELPHMRVVTHKSTGAMVDATTNLMFNADKLADGLKGFLREARGMMRDRTEDAIKMMKEEEQLERRKREEIETKARITEDQRRKTLVDLQHRAELEERINAATATSVTPPRSSPMPSPLARPVTRIEPPVPPRPFSSVASTLTGPPSSAFVPRPPVEESPAVRTNFEQLLDAVLRPAPDAGVPPSIAEAPTPDLPPGAGSALPEPTPQTIPERIAPPIEREDGES